MNLFIKILCIVLLLFNKTLSIGRTSTSLKSCSYDEDCLENSFCRGNSNGQKGKCECKSGFYIFCDRKEYKCVKPTGLNLWCDCDEHCEFTLGLPSECGLKNTCECLPTAHYVEDRNSCYETAALNETCKDDYNCVSKYDNQRNYCVAGICSCGVGLRPTADGKCVKGVPLGGICDSDDSCIHNNAVCQTVCQCRAGYVIDDNEQTCLKAATLLGDPCEQITQCSTYIQGSTCHDGFCICKPGTHSYGNLCYADKYVHDSCKEKAECVRFPSMEKTVNCVGGVCICNDGTDVTKDCSQPGNSPALFKPSLFIIILISIIIIRI